MGSVYDLKPRFQNCLRPLLSFLVKKRVTANMVTLSALGGSLVFGMIIFFARIHPFWLLGMPVWLLIRMALNAIDGMLAREHGMASNLGAVLNEWGDVLSDGFLYFPLAGVQTGAFWPVLFFNLGAFGTEFSGVLGKALGGSRHYEGPMGKSDRAFWIGGLCLLSFFFPGVLVFWKWIFSVLGVLTIVTCWNRIRNTLKELKSKEV